MTSPLRTPRFSSAPSSDLFSHQCSVLRPFFEPVNQNSITFPHFRNFVVRALCVHVPLFPRTQISECPYFRVPLFLRAVIFTFPYIRVPKFWHALISAFPYFRVSKFSPYQIQKNVSFLFIRKTVCACITLFHVWHYGAILTLRWDTFELGNFGIEKKLYSISKWS